MTNPNTPDPARNSIRIELAPGPKRSPAEELVFQEVISGTARRVHARVHCNMDIEFDASVRQQRLQRGIESIDVAELRQIIAADLECEGKEGWGASASGTMAFLDRHLGVHPRIAREKLATLNMESPTFVKDVLAIADGAIQDIGFFVTQETPDGERQVGFDELDLLALNHTLAEAS
jgi:hypothetical protein